MTRDDIIRMAREAGLHRQQHNLMSNPIQYRYSYDGYEENLERFAALVAAAEREACAKVCDEMEASGALSSLEKYRTRFIADAIRARSQS